MGHEIDGRYDRIGAQLIGSPRQRFQFRATLHPHRDEMLGRLFGDAFDGQVWAQVEIGLQWLFGVPLALGNGVGDSRAGEASQSCVEPKLRALPATVYDFHAGLSSFSRLSLASLNSLQAL